MERRGPTPGSGMYGQACVQCARAKSRCVTRANTTGCERCIRLKKQCEPPDAIRRRTLRRRESPSQISRLEGSIATLTTMLHSITSASGVANPNVPQHGSTKNSTDYTTPLSLTDAPSTSQTSPLEPSGSSSSPCLPFEPAMNYSESCKDRFQKYMLPCFPFMSQDALQKDRPLLQQAIVAVATPSAAQKLVCLERLKRRLTEMVVLENESSIEILLSILTYIAWSADPFLKRVNDLPRMMMLAMTVVHDLQLSKAPPREAHVITVMAPGLGVPDVPAGEESVEDSLERHRALLAFFILSSIVSASFGRFVAPQWLPQMEEALAAVEASKACPSDARFAIQVRLQLITQRALSLREQRRCDLPYDAASMYLAALHGQLGELRASIVADLPQTASAHYVELCVNESTRLTTLETPLLPESPSASGLEQIESMWKSLHAVKSWFDAFYTIPPAQYAGFPFFVWFQLVRCVVIAKHLSTFEDPAWDIQAAQQAADVLGMLDWLAEKAEEASREVGEQEDDDMFRHVSRIMRQSQKWVSMKRNATQQEKESSTHENVDIGASMGTDDMSWILALQSGDEGWLEEALGWSPAVV